MLHEKIVKIWCSWVRFGVYFDQIVSRKINIVLHVIMYNYYSYRPTRLLCLLVIAPGNVFGKLMCFNVYFDCILNENFFFM